MRFAYGAITLFGSAFQKLPLRPSLFTPSGICRPHEALTTPDAQRRQACMHRVWALALSLAATHAVDCFLSLPRGT